MIDKIRSLFRGLDKERGDGSLTIVLVMIPLLIVFAGLIIDGGAKAQADQDATAIAQSAARAAVNSAANPELPAGSTVNVYASQAETVAQQYLAAAGMTGDVDINGDTVTVTARKTVAAKIITMIAPTLTGQGTGSAQLRSGP